MSGGFPNFGGNNAASGPIPNNTFLANTSGAAAPAAATPLATVKSTLAPTVNNQAASYVLALGDANNMVRVSNAAANNVTIPAHATVAFAVGTAIVIEQSGVGATTLVAAAGVTINNPSSLALKLAGQYAQIVVRQTALNVWDATGQFYINSLSIATAVAGTPQPVIVQGGINWNTNNGFSGTFPNVTDDGAGNFTIDWSQSQVELLSPIATFSQGQVFAVSPLTGTVNLGSLPVGRYFLVNATAGNVNITLPLAAITTPGTIAGDSWIIGFKRIDSSANTVTIHAAGANTFGDTGLGTLALAALTFTDLLSDGSSKVWRCP